MAYINDTFETSNGSKVQVRVPSSQGGSDRIIYVKGNNSGYKLGNQNDEVYNISSGSQAYKSIKDFIKNKYWDTLCLELLLRDFSFL